MEKRIEVYRNGQRIPVAIVYSMEAAKAVSRLYKEWLVFRWLVRTEGNLGRVVSASAYSGVLIGEE